VTRVKFRKYILNDEMRNSNL